MKSPGLLERYAGLVESMLPRHFDLTVDVSRAVHRPLLQYSRLLAGQVMDVRGSIQLLEDCVWSALIFHVAGELLHEPVRMERSRKTFLDLISHQQPGGAFFAPDVHANPETRWYEELVTLHAIASYAVRVRDASIDRAVKRAAEFHLSETQPDHATAEPWGLLAFIQYAPPLADQVLHAMSMQYPQRITGVPLLLMVDVLYGLRRLIADGR